MEQTEWADVIESNQTRYNTHDLEAVIAWTIGWVHERLSDVPAARRQDGRDGSHARGFGRGSRTDVPVPSFGSPWRDHSVRVDTARGPWASSDGRTECGVDRVEKWTGQEGLKDTPRRRPVNDEVLLLFCPARLPLAPVLESLGAAALEGPVVARRVVGDIARWWWDAKVRANWLHSRKGEELDRAWGEGIHAAAMAGAPEVRIMRNRADQPTRLTAEQSMARLRGLHGDPTREMEGSYATGRYLWERRLSEAAYYYVREWERREKWAQKIRSKVEQEAPGRASHDTFAEHLRKLADEFEAGKGRTKAAGNWGGGWGR